MVETLFRAATLLKSARPTPRIAAAAAAGTLRLVAYKPVVARSIMRARRPPVAEKAMGKSDSVKNLSLDHSACYLAGSGGAVIGIDSSTVDGDV